MGFSDHFLVPCHVFIKNICLKSTYWHFNTALLDGQDLELLLSFFWESHRDSRCSPHVHSSFLSSLTQVSEVDNSELAAEVTLQELHTATMSLQSGRAPGMDGLPADFLSFWSTIGPDLLEVINESLKTGKLPLSCRRAAVTLLPKKGDLQELKNWRPVSLLCTDYKILSKALALRLSEMMASIIHPDQTYCVPGRLISDNVTLIRDVLELSNSLGIQTGLISIDQEKAFDRVENQYLWGGQGLVHPASRGTAFRHQFIQRLLTGPKTPVPLHSAGF